MKKLLLILFTLTSLGGFAQSTTLVISQLYGSGGNAGALYTADYVELHNISTTAQSLSGFSIQYASATNTAAWTGVAALPAVSIPPGGYYLIQMSSPGAVGSAIPTPDHVASPTISMSGTNGRVALVNGTAALTGCPTTPDVIDLVGYGSSVCFETAALAVLSATTAGLRNNNGCTETNNNSTDFTAGTPAPRNGATPAFTCTGGPAGPAVSAGAVNSFGNVLVLATSASQSFSLSGSNLTGFPGNLTLTSPGPDFQVSADNTTWGATAVVPYTAASLASTPAYVRFTPQSVGLKTGNVTISGGGLASPVTVPVSGTGVSSLPAAGNLVISQLYGAGGNSGSLFHADYVEIHNRTSTPQSIDGYSIQYASATATANWSGKAKLPAVVIPGGGYYLVQMSAVGLVGAPLPTPDFSANPTIAMSASNGRVALVSDTFTLSGCPTTANILDLVGYGTSVCFETAATPALDTLKAGFRNNNGCDDTNNNQADFTLATPAPRNSASPVAVCTVVTTPLITASTLSDFGSVVVGNASTPQTLTFSGVNLTGAPGTITITAPVSFQLSSDGGVTWVTSLTVPFTSATLASTTISVQFLPSSVGTQSGTLTLSGGGASTSVTVSGTGSATPVPTVTSTPLAPFGNLCVNLTSSPSSFTLTGSQLTAADLVVGPLSGYSFALVSGGPFSATLTITHAPGSLSQQVFVVFAPTAVASYNGSISITGGGLASPAQVAVSGSGVNAAPGVTAGAASSVTASTATLSGTITSIGCSSVTAYGIEYSTTNGFANGSGTQVPSSNLTAGAFSSAISGLAASTTYYYKAYATNAGGTTYSNQAQFTTSAPPPPSISATALADFGDVCVNATSAPQSFDLSGTNLSAAPISVGPLTGYAFSAAQAGPFTPTISLTQPGGSFAQSVYVIFTPGTVGPINGTIPVAGGGLTTPLAVPVTGNGAVSTAVVLTGDSSDITSNSAIIRGSIPDTGCSRVTAYGIEYSGINGFVGGTGIRVPGGSLSGDAFTSVLVGLVQNTAYYYRAYAINTGGVIYGEQKALITRPIPAGLIVYSNPAIRGARVRYSLSGILPGHYALRIFNSVGQLVFQKDMIIQVNFIDDQIVFPAHLPLGLYTFQIFNPSFKIQKQVLVN